MGRGRGGGGRAGRAVGGAAPKIGNGGAAAVQVAPMLQTRLNRVAPGATVTMQGDAFTIEAPMGGYSARAMDSRVTPVIQRTLPDYRQVSKGVRGNNATYRYEPRAGAGGMSALERNIRGL